MLYLDLIVKQRAPVRLQECENPGFLGSSLLIFSTTCCM